MTTPPPNPSLIGSVTSLRTSTALLQSSLNILSTGTADLPRLSRAVAQTRHFELLPSSSLAAARAALLSELAPEVEALLARAERHVEKLERREAGLRARWELQEGRLGREVLGKRGAAATSVAPQQRQQGEKKVGGGGGGGGMEELRAKQLRQKKERLSYAVERLQMQAQQTERRLRMSMAAQERQSEEADKGGDEDGDWHEF